MCSFSSMIWGEFFVLSDFENLSLNTFVPVCNLKSMATTLVEIYKGFGIRGYWQVYISGGADICRGYLNINSNVT